MTTYLDELPKISEQDVISLHDAEKRYGDSWKKRGGIGAFMMAARKWDRLENTLREDSPPWDIFARIEFDQSPGGIMDDIRDLRRYLLLIEAEMITRGVVILEERKSQ